MATWRNGSAFGFDRPTVPKGCRFESCGGHFFKFHSLCDSHDHVVVTDACTIWAREPCF